MSIKISLYKLRELSYDSIYAIYVVKY